MHAKTVEGLPLDVNAALAAILAASNDCIKILDLDGRLLFMSEGGQRVMEIADFAEVKECPWPDFWQGDGNTSAVAAIAEARAGKSSRFLGFANTFLGNRRFWDVQVIPIGGVDGKPTHILSISRDVSDLQLADREVERLSAKSRESEMKFRVLADTMPQMVWSTLPDGYHDYYNARWYEFTGTPYGSTDGEGWNGLFHPDDQPRARAVWNRSLATGEPYEIEYRLRHHSGSYRWTLGRALAIRDVDGTIVRWYGTCTDVHEAKQIADNLALLSQELSHRIKNIFAIVNGLIGLSARRFPESKQFAYDIQQRIAALGRAHDFARPHSDESRPVTGEATLNDLLTEILRPYPALDEGRLLIEGDHIAIDDRSATPLAMIFHELATNSTKYGALSSAEGMVSLRSTLEAGLCRIEWVESGGPEILGAPARTGFGTKLSTVSAEGHLGGRIERHWLRTGLHAVITCPVSSLRKG